MDIFDSIFYDSFGDIFSEAAKKNTTTTITRDRLYPKIEAVLSTSVGDRKFKQIVGSYIDKNNDKLYTAGPVYPITFGEVDKEEYFHLFKIKKNDVVNMVKEIVSYLGSKSDFKLLTGQPIFWVFYCCIRYYTLKKDEKGLNSALAIYAISVYPSIFALFFRYKTDEGVMQYTIDNLSEKFLIKKEKNLFNTLFRSIHNSYDFLKESIIVGDDNETIRFIQRIRNDQKSMMRNIADNYIRNYRNGLRVSLTKDSYDQIQLDVDNQNNTTVVEVISENIINQIIANGLELKRVKQAKDLTGISMYDCRFYLSKIVNDKHIGDISNFIKAILFMFLYIDKYNKEDINSSRFLTWSAELFRKTNSNNPNIKIIKDTLDKWGEETGVHTKFKREASRINYKKAIYWYFILSIQYYNK